MIYCHSKWESNKDLLLFDEPLHGFGQRAYNFRFVLRWLDTVFSKIQVFNTWTCSNYAFLGFIQLILVFLYILLYILIILPSNNISFSNR